VHADVHNICLTYTHAHAWCATTPVNTCGLCAKNACGLVYVRLFKCAVASLPWKLLRTYLESCANIAQAVVYCPPFHPPSCRQSVARRCSLKKSVQIHASSWRGRHCGVAQASSDHPRWCRPHPVLKKLICSNVHSGAAALSASMMLLCCSLASSSFTPRKSLFLSDDRLKSRTYSVRWFLLITMLSGFRFQKRFS